MNKKIWSEKEKDALINEKVKIDFGQGVIAWGYISSKKDDFAIIFCREFMSSFSVSWDLADRAVNQGVIITY